MPISLLHTRTHSYARTHIHIPFFFLAHSHTHILLSLTLSHPLSLIHPLTLYTPTPSPNPPSSPHTQACYPIFSKDPNFRGLRADRNYPQNWKNPPLKSLFNGEVKEVEEGEGATEEFPEGSYAQDGSYAQEGTYFHTYCV